MFTAVLMVAMTSTDVTPDFGRRRRGCHGCRGGYAGCSGGCYGGGYGGCCGGGYGGCTGGGSMGCTGGCTGGGYRVYGGYGSPEGYYRETMPKTDGQRERIDLNNPNQSNEDVERVSQPAPARIVVQLPADARLTIDGATTKSTSDQRVFATPPLQRGRIFYYTFIATLDRDGQPVSTEQRVRVRAGEETRVKMDFPATALTRK